MEFNFKEKTAIVSFSFLRGTESQEEFEKKYEHYHFNFPEDDLKMPVTTCIIRDKETKEVLSITKAECSPKDTFIKVIGEKVALSRGLRKLELDKYERTKVWWEYLLSSKSRRKLISSSLSYFRLEEIK